MGLDAVCSFCGETSPSRLIWHHWEATDGSFGTAKVCYVCNNLLRQDRMERQFRGFPPRGIQKAYCRAYRKVRSGGGFTRVLRREALKEGYIIDSKRGRPRKGDW